MTVEPWLRGTLTEVDALRRQVLHALELTEEDLATWCRPLSDAELGARPFGIASVAFHVRHIGRSLDRLMTYAEGGDLDAGQMAALGSEHDAGFAGAEVFAEFERSLAEAKRRIAAIDRGSYEMVRGVGRDHLPTTVGGLLIHCAEHTQRHSGQAITTAKVVVGMRSR